MTANNAPALTTAPFNRLVRSDKNVRRTGKADAKYKQGIEELAATILDQGILQNLVVHATDEGLAVNAGGRRYDALALLVEREQIPDDYPVPILVLDEQAVTAASLTENVQRQAMHPADEFDAFRQLTSEGWSIDRIADTFGVTPLVVERRLKLAAAAPSLLDLYRADAIDTDQLIALCATDDHALQLAVWERCGGMGYMSSAANLRRAVLETNVQATDPRVRLIGGLEAYEAAGGIVRRDLFAEDGAGVILEDAPLLETLVAQRLEDVAESVRAEGWGWVDVWSVFDHDAFWRFGQVTFDVLPDADRAEIERLEAEAEAMMEPVREAWERDDLSDEEEQAHSEIEQQADALHKQAREIAARATCAPEVKAKAGALVAVRCGEIEVKRGLVRAADRKTIMECEGGEVQGGRESTPAGRKEGALSDALRRSLLGHRNIAAQTSVAASPDTAKILMVCWAVQNMRSIYGNVPTDLVIGDNRGFGTRTQHDISDSEAEPKREAFKQIGQELTASLPTDSVELWDALTALPAADLDRLLAYAVARSVSLTEEHAGLTAKLLSATGFDMAQHFNPTVDNYFGRVSKDLIVAALEEAGKLETETEKASLLAMKKGALAALAEERLNGSGWVPTLIRTPEPEPVTAAPAKKRKRSR